MTVESEYRKWLNNPEAHVKKCVHGSNPGLCIACAHAITEKNWESTRMKNPVAERTPTHRCKVCGCKWILWPAGTLDQPEAWWSLATNAKAGPCCDNVAMGDQIEEMPLSVWLVLGPEGSVEFGCPWPEMCHEHINAAIEEGVEDAAQWIVREYAPV